MGWLITIAILVLLAILPLGAAVRYNSEGVSLKVIAGPIRIPILPAKKKDPEEEKKKKEKKKEGKKAKPKPSKEKKPAEPKEKEKGGSLLDFIPLVKVVLDLLNGFRKKLRIKRLELKLIMAGDDPCDLAVNYGKANAAMGNLLPLLDRTFVIKKRDLEVECDFEASETLVIARADITITLGWILGLVVWHGVRAVKEFLKMQNKRKGGASK